MYAIFVATMYTSIFPYEILSYIYSYIEIFLLGIKILMIERATRALVSQMRSLPYLVAMPASHAARMCSLQLFSLMHLETLLIVCPWFRTFGSQSALEPHTKEKHEA